MARKAVLEKNQALLAASREEKRIRILEKQRKDSEETALRLGLLEKQKTVLNSKLPQLDVKSFAILGDNFLAHHKNEQGPLCRKKLEILSLSNVESLDIPPKRVDVYTKQTQTTSYEHNRQKFMHQRDIRAKNYYVLYFGDPPSEDEEENSTPNANSFNSKLSSLTLQTNKNLSKAIMLQELKNDRKKENQVKALSEEQKQTIILSEEYCSFFMRTGRIMERVLSESIDVHTDYIRVNQKKSDDRKQVHLQLNRTFFCDNMSKNRCITSMDWSKHFPELVVASYCNNAGEISKNPNGGVVVWNTKYKKSTPEDVFHSQSSVMSTCFANFNPNLILGGTYSGRIVLWDNRVLKRTPVQSSILSARGHTHPVYCLQMTGTQNAHEVISISSDGKLCSWNLDMLSKPQHTISLDPISINSMAFLNNGINNFVVGAEDGYAYSILRNGTKASVHEIYEKHFAPITGISAHYNQYMPDFSQLFLTSSMDWSVKLWTLKEEKPLYSFRNTNNYVMDVAWSPIHPALFACVDESGRLDLWNLNKNIDIPTASAITDESSAYNCVSWASSGMLVAAGDDTGKLHIYDIAENVAHPRMNEWNIFNETLNELKINQIDEIK